MLVGCALVVALGAALHIAILFGGADWYALFGAPPRLVEMARHGDAYAPLSCLVIALVLLVFAGYALSGAAVLRPLPLRRTVLVTIAAILIVRGLVFVPLVLWRPALLAGICDCRRLDAFVVSTSLLCLLLGGGYSLGAWRLLRR